MLRLLDTKTDTLKIITTKRKVTEDWTPKLLLLDIRVGRRVFRNCSSGIENIANENIPSYFFANLTHELLKKGV